MNLFFRLGLSCILGGIIFAYVLLPAQTSIETPRIGQPAIVTPGESLSIKLKTNIPYWRPDMEITLVSTQTQQVLNISKQSYSTNKVFLNAVIPQSLAPGSYNLKIKFGTEDLIRAKAVHVLEQYPQELSIVQLADLPTLGGDGAGDKLLAKLIAEINLINPSVVLFTGDLAYGGGNWYQYERLLEAMSTIDAPVIAAPGNHEYEGWSGFLTLLGNPDHSVSFGDYHFISLNSGHGRDQLTLSQFKWLTAKLQQNKDKTQIVQLHHPVKHRKELRGYLHHHVDQFSTLLERFTVPIVLSGHWHGDAVYDKNGKEYSETWEFPGTPYVVTTAAGADLREKYSSSPLHHGYRLIRLKGSVLESYTYDYDEDGQRDASSSIPVGRLNIHYESRMNVSVKNELAETFEKAKVNLRAPVSMGNLQPNRGRILNKYRENDGYRYEIGFSLPAKSMVNITLQ